MNINSFRDILDPRETALLLFTRNKQLEVNEDATGYSGNWILSPNRGYSRIVLYKRDSSSPGGMILSATHVETKKSAQPRRYRVFFADCVTHGRTNRTWKEFAETGQNPVRYVSWAPELIK